MPMVPPGPGPMVLLQNPGVQQELQLTPEQRAAVGQLFQRLKTKFQDEFRKAGRGGNPELRKSLADSAWGELPGILRPEQERRLREIETQARGAQALLDPDIQERLGLSEDQKGQLRTLLDAVRAEAQELMRQAKAQRNPQSAEKVAGMRRDALTRATAILTESQNQSFRDLLGAPFELKLAPRGPARRPGPGPGRRMVDPDALAGPDFDDL